MQRGNTVSSLRQPSFPNPTTRESKACSQFNERGSARAASKVRYSSHELPSLITANFTTPYRKGIADEQLARAEMERSRKRDRDRDMEDFDESITKRRRSRSLESVSTISTTLSRSRSPSEDHHRVSNHNHRRSMSHSPRRSLSKRPGVDGKKAAVLDKKRRRDSTSSSSSASSSYDSDETRALRRRDPSRKNRRRIKSRSPNPRGRKPSGMSPDRARTAPSHRRQGSIEGRGRTGQEDRGFPAASPKAAPRQKSLSPFSKRLALTQSLGGRK